jgi:hypothetical protein
MPTYYITLSLTPPPEPRDGDVIQLLRRAVETAMCVAIEISARGMIVECDTPSVTVLEEALRGEPRTAARSTASAFNESEATCTRSRPVLAGPSVIRCD